MTKKTGDFNTRLFPTPNEAKTICRLGQGSKCCPWLVVGPDGFECERMDFPANAELYRRIEAGAMTSKGEPCDWDKTSATAVEASA